MPAYESVGSYARRTSNLRGQLLMRSLRVEGERKKAVRSISMTWAKAIAAVLVLWAGNAWGVTLLWEIGVFA